MRIRCLCLLALLIAANDLLAAGRQLTGQYAPASTAPLPPTEAQKKFTAPPGFASLKILAIYKEILIYQ